MKKKLGIVWGLILISIGLNVFGKSKLETEPLLKSFERYRESEEVDFKIKKNIFQSALGKESSFEGNFSISKGKFHLETEFPDRTTLIYDGTYLWSVEYQGDSAATPPQVSKSRVNKKGNGNFLFALLFGNKSLQSSFDLKKEESQDGLEVYSLKPRNEMNISDLLVFINPKDGLIVKIIYNDDIGNRTTLHFLTTQFLNSAKHKLFKFKLPKGAQVTEL